MSLPVCPGFFSKDRAAMKRGVSPWRFRRFELAPCRKSRSTISIIRFSTAIWRRYVRCRFWPSRLLDKKDSGWPVRNANSESAEAPYWRSSSRILKFGFFYFTWVAGECCQQKRKVCSEKVSAPCCIVVRDVTAVFCQQGRFSDTGTPRWCAAPWSDISCTLLQTLQWCWHPFLHNLDVLWSNSSVPTVAFCVQPLAGSDLQGLPLIPLPFGPILQIGEKDPSLENWVHNAAPWETRNLA